MSRSLGDPNWTDSENMFVAGDGDRVCAMHTFETPEGTVDYMAVQPERGDEPEQRGPWGTEMPARNWITKDLAIQALHYFIEHGGRDPGIEWVFDFLDPNPAPVKTSPP